MVLVCWAPATGLAQDTQAAVPSDSEPKTDMFDLSKWVVEGPPGNGGWRISKDGQSVLQTTNGGPTFFVSPRSVINTTIRGRIVVNTASDDDYIGFVFGFQSPNTQQPDYLDFLLFDWKQGDQGVAKEGFCLREVRLAGTATGALFWQQEQREDVKVLGELYKKSIGMLSNKGLGWKDKVEYSFELKYTEESIVISLSGGQFGEGGKVFEVNGTFQAGRFGFYNYSQQSVRYSGFTKTTRPASSQPTVVRPGLRRWVFEIERTQ